MNKRMKVGIIGMGTIGAVHAEAYAANAREADLTAICDVSGERLNVQGDRFNVANRVGDYRELLAGDVDAVSVCVGNALHKEVAVAAFKAGKHVLLEKPMAMNAAEAGEIVAAARRSRRVLQIGMVRRQSGETQKARQCVADGLLGGIYHMRAVLIRNRGIPGLGGWFTTKAMSGGGPLIDIGVHWFDSAMYVSGLWKPTSVSASCYDRIGRNMKAYKFISMWAGPPNFKGVFDVEDYATGLVRFGRKATMSFEIAWAANTEDSAYVEILGDRGGLRIFDGKPFLIRSEHHGSLADIALRFPDPGNIFHIQAGKFLAACRGERPPAATGEEGLTVMRLMDAVYKSGKLGREVGIR